MLNPIQLAQQERDRQAAIAIARRTQQQRAEESATTLTGFWESYDAAQGLHRIRTSDGGVIYAQSGVNTGFAVGRVVTVARAKGESIGRIRVRR